MVRKKNGFTLIELLLVIVIISILAVLIMPVMTMVRELARRAVDKKNLQELGRACLYYANDYGEYLPIGKRNKFGRDDQLEWVNYTSCWKILQNQYGVKEGMRGCQGFIMPDMSGANDYGVPDNEYPDDTKVGWIYWGGRDNIESVQPDGSRKIEYISPKKMNTQYNPSSPTLFTCLCYDSTKALYGMGWPWPSAVPHVHDKTYWYPPRTPLNPELAGKQGGPPDGLGVLKLDWSVDFVDWSNLVSVHSTQDYFYATH